ncbi:MAG: DUF4838 domain-containing protein [Verrucomicrobiales bacterium]
MKQAMKLTHLIVRSIHFASIFVAAAATNAATAGKGSGNELVVVNDGQTTAVVIVSPDAGPHEKLAADDLVKYAGQISGAKPTLANSAEAVKQALASSGPVLIVGQEAIKARPALAQRIAAVLKKNPRLNTDGIGIMREGNKVFIAGNNDASHYYAVAELLKHWGCRWYLPTGFGECIPDDKTLKVGEIDFAYSSPFEIRSYWLSWNGVGTGQREFQLRNMMQVDRVGMPSSGHALGAYTNDAPGSKGTFNFPITAPETARHVAGKVEKNFANNEHFSLGMEDGLYESAYPRDQELMKLQFDKYFMRTSVTDPMLELYNNVAKILQDKHPQSRARIGFLAYANMTLAPVRDMKAERSLWCELAPIDIDPIHGMDHPDSPPRQEYRDMLHKWAKVMDGRVSIYDYDQGMLVWRDIPNPSHMAFRQDVKHYAQAGILGVNTESRGAIATVFLNLFLRGQLMWNPDADVDALLAEFYPKFYGPAAEPMRAYWTAIYDAWENTIVTEHEYFIAPAIYTPQVMTVLAMKIAEAELAVAPLTSKPDRTTNEELYVQRIKFTRKSYDILNGYMSMAKAAATDGDYANAARSGDAALAVREALTDMNGTFTTYRTIGEGGAPWWPGEVEQYKKLAKLTDGADGRLISKLPIEWAFHRDNDHSGLTKGYHTDKPDLTYWNANAGKLNLDNRKDYPTNQWELLRTDLYAQAQGIRHPDRQSYLGHLWYHTEIDLAADKIAGHPHLMFPGLFNECWLYINGQEIAHREQGRLYWLNDYAFQWDVDLTGKLQPGKNTVVLRANCEHHFGGIFRRPFLYEPSR